jgi:hypothetical protein
VGAIQWRQDRKRSIQLQTQAQVLQESEQASRVSGLLKVVLDRPKGDVLQILVLNTSELPILDVTISFEAMVEVRLADESSKRLLKYAYEIPEPYVLPRTTHEFNAITIGPHVVGQRTTIVGQRSVTVYFQDANGIRWRKATGLPPEKR